MKIPSKNSRRIGQQRYQKNGFFLKVVTCQIAMNPCDANTRRVITALIVAKNFAILINYNFSHFRARSDKRKTDLASFIRVESAQHTLAICNHVSSLKFIWHIFARVCSLADVCYYTRRVLDIRRYDRGRYKIEGSLSTVRRCRAVAERMS